MKTEHRVAKIASLCRGKTVLDLGCVNPESIDVRSKKGVWLHERIREVAKHVIGIDIDGEGIERLREQGYEAYPGNIEHLEAVHDPGPVDLIVAGDIIEHLSNAGQFLDGAHRFFGPETRMLITTNNAFYWKGFVYTWQKRERVHPEHTCYYSHNTLKQLLERHGYVVEKDMFSLLDSSEFPITQRKKRAPWLKLPTPMLLIRKFLYRRTLRFSQILIFVVSSTRTA